MRMNGDTKVSALGLGDAKDAPELPDAVTM
jgi:hypothetical protein